MRLKPVLVGLVVGLLVTACGGAPQSGRPGGSAEGAPPHEKRTLRVVARYELDNLALKVISGIAPINTRRFFNASLALVDGAGTARPYLAVALPQLNSEGWQVYPDGRMDTRYTLRPNLTWHDGQPLTADDFVFAWRMYTAPALALFSPVPQDRMAEVIVMDAGTLLIRWSSPHPQAGALREDLLDPLPRHILERPFAAYLEDPAARDALVNHPFWTGEYVALGPFRLVRWEPGASFEGEAFDGHALGRPKIDRLIIRIVADENATLTNVLAGDVDLTLTNALRFEHGLVLRRDWQAAGRGVVHIRPWAVVASAVQFRPEFQKTPGMLDVRVRRALAHALDRQALNDGLFDGQGFPAEIVVHPLIPYAAAVDRASPKYPYDPRRTEQLMVEAGYGRDRDGLFADPRGERFRPDLWVLAGPQFERQQVIMAETWRRAGIDTDLYVVPAAVGRDNEARATFPGLMHIGTGSSEDQIVTSFLGSQIGSPANRWRGRNRTGWSHPEVDRQWDAYYTTLDPPERERQIVEISRLLNEHLPAYPLYAEPQTIAQVGALSGYDSGVASTLPNWNIHEWQLR